METLASRVKILNPSIKLHWPHWWCQMCGGETRVTSPEEYMCVSCGHISQGRTEIIQSEMRLL